jgi:ABC-type proline/glycine betaine transport system ATPase subunit
LHKCIHVSLKKSVKVRSVDMAVEGAKIAVVFGCSGSETFLGPCNTVRYDYMIHAIAMESLF